MDDKRFGREAWDFRERLQDLLERTVCDGPRLKVATIPPLLAVVGRDVSAHDLRGAPIPLRKTEHAPQLYALLQFTLAPDQQGEHLMVVSSVLGVCLDVEARQELFHVDYERDKSDGYPEAHLQVIASSPEWEKVLAGSSKKRRKRALSKLHLPAGGRRYRTTVEDLVAFLAAETLVDCRTGWETAVEEYRNEFEERQLRAAVRRRPEIAQAALDDLQRS